MRRLAVLLVVAWAGVGVAQEKAAGKAPPRPSFNLKLHLELDGPAQIKASQIKPALFPQGKRCCFTYVGPTNPQVIARLSKLGFRTTLYVDPARSSEQLKAWEDAGADVGINIWGGKGTYASHIGANTIQEAFDAVITSRLVLRSKCRGALGAAAIGGHYGTLSFPVDRDPDNGSGFGYAYHDGNYLLLSDNKPYMIYLGRQGDLKQILDNRDNFDNRMDSRSVPNETIYYQILANQMSSTIKRAEKGQVVRISLRDFKPVDLDELCETIGKYGQHELIWHATESEIGANEYVRDKVRVQDVQPSGGGLDVTLSVDQDIFPPFLLTPLPLELPKGTKLKSASVGSAACAAISNSEGTFVDVPLRQILAGALKMSLKPAAPDMTAPDEMDLTLTLKNTGDKPVQGKLSWVGNIGIAIAGGEGPLTLAAGEEKAVAAKAKTDKACRFGIVPVRAMLTSGEQVLMEGFELVVAPRLAVEVDPMQSIPMKAGRPQHFLVHIANVRGENRFISHKAGPCKGFVAWDLPPGMKAIPEKQAFELGADQRKTLVFKLESSQYRKLEPAQEREMARPVVQFEGESEPVCVLFPGTVVLRDESAVAPKPLDDKGLLVYASWDDNARNGLFDKSVGNPGAHFYPGHRAAYNNEGVKAWCMNTQGVCQIHDSWKNIDYYEGTAMFYVRKDPLVRNENTFVPDPKSTINMGCGRSNEGEMLFCAGLVQTVGSSDSGITLRRFRSWQGKPGYLQLTYQNMSRKLIACQAGPFEWTEEWRHVAILWSVKDRRLELYIDGKLAAKAGAGEGEWMASPWDRGRPSGWNLQIITSDHGNWTGTCRDEVYIYNRALTPEEILANKELCGKK